MRLWRVLWSKIKCEAGSYLSLTSYYYKYLNHYGQKVCTGFAKRSRSLFAPTLRAQRKTRQNMTYECKQKRKQQQGAEHGKKGKQTRRGQKANPGARHPEAPPNRPTKRGAEATGGTATKRRTTKHGKRGRRRTSSEAGLGQHGGSSIHDVSVLMPEESRPFEDGSGILPLQYHI